MTELIKVTEHEGKQAVSLKALYEYLQLNKAHYSRWTKENIANNQYALEGEDWQRFAIMVNGNKTNEYVISLEFAKKLSMMQRTEKGEEAREYFIECEKQLQESKHQIPQTFSEALLLASKQAEQIELQKSEIKELAPKGEFYDQVTGSEDTIDIGKVAKVINKGIGRNTLFQKLRDMKILQDNNVPYQHMIDRGYFRVIESKYQKPDGSTHISLKTVVYQKGVDYIIKKLNLKQ